VNTFKETREHVENALNMWCKHICLTILFELGAKTSRTTKPSFSQNLPPSLTERKKNWSY
jgi:hypothetical protein